MNKQEIRDMQIDKDYEDFKDESTKKKKKKITFWMHFYRSGVYQSSIGVAHTFKTKEELEQDKGYKVVHSKIVDEIEVDEE